MSNLALAARKTALVVIDLQQGILAMATEPRPSSDVVTNALRLTEVFRAKGAFVVLVHVEFSADDVDMLRPECDAPTVIPKGRPETWSAYAPGLVRDGDHLLAKKQWGAFYGTDLELQLRRRGISTIVLCGIATAFGVESTARQAFELGYEQVFVEDAMASRAAAEHEHVVTRILPRMGRVRKVDEVIAALS